MPVEAMWMTVFLHIKNSLLGALCLLGNECVVFMCDDGGEVVGLFILYGVGRFDGRD